MPSGISAPKNPIDQLSAGGAHSSHARIKGGFSSENVYTLRPLITPTLYTRACLIISLPTCIQTNGAHYICILSISSLHLSLYTSSVQNITTQPPRLFAPVPPPPHVSFVRLPAAVTINNTSLEEEIIR